MYFVSYLARVVRSGFVRYRLAILYSYAIAVAYRGGTLLIREPVRISNQKYTFSQRSTIRGIESSNMLGSEKINRFDCRSARSGNASFDASS